MKVKLPVLVKDRSVADYKDIDPTEEFIVDSEDVFLDGPVTNRVAVLDFDPNKGSLAQPAKFATPQEPGAYGSYQAPRNGFDDPSFMQVVVFGGVMKTMHMFEEADNLGRRIRWAFDGLQLLVVPRAGDWANAYYERESRSLQFFYFTPNGAGKEVYTCQSQDIISHETAHAILDDIAPDLYHATTPESLAIHESLADLTTLIMALRSRALASRVLEQCRYSLEHPSAFTAVAPEFGMALGRHGHALRNLKNDRKISDRDL